MSVMIMMPICDHGKSSAGNLAGVLEFFNSLDSCSLALHNCQQKLRSFGAETTCHTLSGFSVNAWKWHHKQVHLFAMLVWSFLILFSMQSTDSSTRMRKTNTKNREENNLNHRCQTSKLKPVLFLQVCSAFRSGNGHQTHSLWSCHLPTARGGESPLLLPIWTLWERERDMMWCFSLLQLGALH